MQYNTRIDLIDNLITKNGIYAEIGIFKGDFSQVILDKLNPKKLVLIDLFSGEVGSGDQDGNNMSYVDLDEEFKKLLEKYKSDKRVEILKGDSSSLLNSYPNNYFDMIYIDGDHSYDGCKKDLDVAYKKCKINGYICGHDYEMNMDKASTSYVFGVNRAVNEFIQKNNLKIDAKGMDGCITYAIKKIDVYSVPQIFDICKQYTMLTYERVRNNIECVNYISKFNIPGDIVEIGVWKGGSIMSMLLALENNKSIRDVHLYDTFAGMTKPTDLDNDKNKEIDITQNLFDNCYCSIEEVKDNLTLIDYPEDKLHYHKGDICENKTFPEKIALLRLDTDWYESTKYELENFYPLVVKGGIVIIDDYGHSEGCKKAVDEFLKDKKLEHIYKIDYSGIFFIKN
jgi:O-methyltransferase